MHDNPGSPWTLQELADRVGMSRTVFAQRFKQRVGTTAMEYLTRWRMSVAGDRLRGTHDPVSAISSKLVIKRRVLSVERSGEYGVAHHENIVNLLVPGLHRCCFERIW